MSFFDIIADKKRIKMRYVSILLTLLLFFSSANCNENNIPAPSFLLKTANKGDVNIVEVDNGVKFKELKDKVVALVFIAYNGKPCLHLIKILNNMKKKHTDFDSFAVEMRKLKGEELKKYAKDKNIEFPIIGYENAKEFTNYIAQKAGWSGVMPFILIIDKKGVVKYMQIGVLSEDNFEKIYQKLRG